MVNYQQGYQGPATTELLQRKRNLGDMLGGAIHSLVPERENVDADGNPIAGQPYQKAGFFRSLLGDRSNALNLAAGAGARDLSTARGMAEAQEGADVRNEQRDITNKRGIMGYGNDLAMKRDRFQNGLDTTRDTWRSALGLNSDSTLLGRKHELGQAADEAEFGRRKQLMELGNENALGLENRRTENDIKLRGVPQAWDQSRIPHKETFEEKMAALDKMSGGGAVPAAGRPPSVIPAQGVPPSTPPNGPMINPPGATDPSTVPFGLTRPSSQGQYNPSNPILDAIVRRLATQRATPTLNAQ